jgi:hypothetical protein
MSTAGAHQSVPAHHGDADIFARISRVVLAGLLGAALLIAALRGGSYDAASRTEGFFLVWWVLLLATALGLLPRAWPTPSIVVVAVALVGLAAWTATSLLWTDSAERTFAEIARVLGFAGLVMLLGCTFAGRDAIVASAAVAIAAVVVCGVSLVTRLAPDVISSTLAIKGYESRRLSAPFNYWNAVGCWAVMTVALCLAWSAHAGRWWVRGAALAGIPLAISVAYLTYSRTAAAALVLAVVTVVGLSRHRWTAAVNATVAAGGSAVVVAAVRAQPKIADGTGTAGKGWVFLALAASAVLCLLTPLALQRTSIDARVLPRRLTHAALSAVAALALSVAIVEGPTAVSNARDSFRSAGTVRSTDPTARLTTLGGPRHEIWDVALKSFAAHPLRGSAAGTFEYTWLRRRDEDVFVRDGHSILLESLAELGFPGALAVAVVLLGLLVGAARTALARAASPQAVAAAAGGTAAFLAWAVTASVDWMWESTAVTAAGLSAGVIAASIGDRPLEPLRVWARTAAAVLMLLALAVQMPLLAATERVRDSQRAVTAGDFPRAVEDATTAVDAEPWAATPLLQRALVLEATGNLPEASTDARAAADREPTNWRIWLSLARIEAQRGHVTRALRAGARARRLNPKSRLWTMSTPRKAP